MPSSSSSPKIIELRELLAAKYPAAQRASEGSLPTSLEKLDSFLGGGLPHGGTVEIVCRGGGGGLLLSALLRSTLERRGLMALLDGGDSFDFVGVPKGALERLLWVRGRSAARAVQAADLLLRDANLGLVVMDLRSNEAREVYSSATLVKDARRHGVRTRPVCVQRSEWRCILEADNSVCLGFCVVNRLNHLRGEELVRARQEQPYRSMEDLLARVPLNRDERRTLAALGAFNGFGGHRRDALWQMESPLAVEPDLFAQGQPAATIASSLAPMDAAERLQADFDGQNLTTGPHAMALLRPHLPPGVWRAADLIYAGDGQRVLMAGNVICRQRPGTAKGFVFVSLEDETGIANVIVTPKLFEQQRLTLSQEAFLLIEGRVQIAEGTIHIKAIHLEGLRHSGTAHASSYDFH